MSRVVRPRKLSRGLGGARSGHQVFPSNGSADGGNSAVCVLDDGRRNRNAPRGRILPVEPLGLLSGLGLRCLGRVYAAARRVINLILAGRPVLSHGIRVMHPERKAPLLAADEIGAVKGDTHIVHRLLPSCRAHRIHRGRPAVIAQQRITELQFDGADPSFAKHVERMLLRGGNRPTAGPQDQCVAGELEDLLNVACPCRHTGRVLRPSEDFVALFELLDRFLARRREDRRARRKAVVAQYDGVLLNVLDNTPRNRLLPRLGQLAGLNDVDVLRVANDNTPFLLDGGLGDSEGLGFVACGKRFPHRRQFGHLRCRPWLRPPGRTARKRY